MNLSRRSMAALGIFAALVSAGHPAVAGETAAAEALFLEGKALVDRGEVDAACEKFAESQRLEPSSGTLLNLAACHERQGKTATAWAEYRVAERLARQQNKTARVAEARRKADELAPRLSYLTIKVVERRTSLEVKRDGTRIESGGLDTPLPTDPGRHRITVEEAGHVPLALEVTVGDGGDRKEIVLPALARLPQRKAPPPRFEPLEPKRDPTLGLAVGGAGLGLAAVSGVFFLLALSADGSALAECPQKFACSQEALDDESRRDTFATIATVGGIAGAVGVGVGAFLLFGPLPRASASSARPVVVPRAGLGAATLTVEGVF